MVLVLVLVLVLDVSLLTVGSDDDEEADVQPDQVTMAYEVEQLMLLQRSWQGWEIHEVAGSLGHEQPLVRVLRIRQAGTGQVRQRLVVETTVGQAVGGVVGGGVGVAEGSVHGAAGSLLVRGGLRADAGESTAVTASTSEISERILGWWLFWLLY